MQIDNPQPASLYSIALDRATSFARNYQLEAKKIPLPTAIVSDICFKDLFERAISITTEMQILAEEKNYSFKDLVVSSEFKNLLAVSKNDIENIRMYESCNMYRNQCDCSRVAGIVFTKGPAALVDKHNLLTHKIITDSQEYLTMSAANSSLFLFVQRLYEYASTATIAEAIRKRVSLMFINAFNSLEVNIKTFTRTCSLFEEFLELLTKISTKNLKLQPVTYVLCVKHFIELAVSKEETILGKNKNYTFHLKSREFKEILKGSEITAELFIDLCFQNNIQNKLLEINETFS